MIYFIHLCFISFHPAFVAYYISRAEWSSFLKFAPIISLFARTLLLCTILKFLVCVLYPISLSFWLHTEIKSFVVRKVLISTSKWCWLLWISNSSFTTIHPWPGLFVSDILLYMQSPTLGFLFFTHVCVYLDQTDLFGVK